MNDTLARLNAFMHSITQCPHARQSVNSKIINFCILFAPSTFPHYSNQIVLCSDAQLQVQFGFVVVVVVVAVVAAAVSLIAFVS